MNYTPNTRHGNIGAIVIHDADAKKSEMLMQVVGYDRKTGEAITRYLHPEHLPGMRGHFKNDVQYLHDPRQFEISV